MESVRPHQFKSMCSGKAENGLPITAVSKETRRSGEHNGGIYISWILTESANSNHLRSDLIGTKSEELLHLKETQKLYYCTQS